MIVDDIGWNADDPKRHVNTDVFVVIRYKLDLPSLRLTFWSGRCRPRLFPCFRSSLGVFGSAGEKNSTYRIVLQVVVEGVRIARKRSLRTNNFIVDQIVIVAGRTQVKSRVRKLTSGFEELPPGSRPNVR